jgi:hypothetical protein
MQAFWISTGQAADSGSISKHCVGGAFAFLFGLLWWPEDTYV